MSKNPKSNSVSSEASSLESEKKGTEELLENIIATLNSGVEELAEAKKNLDQEKATAGFGELIGEALPKVKSSILDFERVHKNFSAITNVILEPVYSELKDHKKTGKIGLAASIIALIVTIITAFAPAFWTSPHSRTQETTTPQIVDNEGNTLNSVELLVQEKLGLTESVDSRLREIKTKIASGKATLDSLQAELFSIQLSENDDKQIIAATIIQLYLELKREIQLANSAYYSIVEHTNHLLQHEDLAPAQEGEIKWIKAQALSLANEEQEYIELLIEINALTISSRSQVIDVVDNKFVDLRTIAERKIEVVETALRPNITIALINAATENRGNHRMAEAYKSLLVNAGFNGGNISLNDENIRTVEVVEVYYRSELDRLSAERILQIIYGDNFLRDRNYLIQRISATSEQRIREFNTDVVIKFPSRSQIETK